MTASVVASRLPVLVAENAAQMAGLERDWKWLQQRAHPQIPFQRWEWQRSWIETQGRRLSPLVAVAAGPDGTPAGLLALQRRWRHGLRQLEFLGQGSGADDLDCLLSPAAESDTAARLLDVLLHRGGWDVLRCEGAREDGYLVGAVARGGCGCHSEPGEWLPCLDLPRHFEQFLEQRSANFRAQLRRRQRRLAQLDPKIHVERLATPAAVTDGLPLLFRLHQQRRRQKGQLGAFSTLAAHRFLLQAAARLAIAGQSQLYLLRTPSRVIAALFGFEAGRRFFYYQSGFDPAWTQWSPGMVLMSGVIEDCIRRGLQHFEFLRGDEAYKFRWTHARRRNLVLHAARGTLGQAFLRLRAWRRDHLAQEAA